MPKHFASYKDVRIGVYAIAADEPESFIERWLDSMKGADKIWVLITKTNNPNYKYLCTKAKLPQFANKLYVFEKAIKQWRFDTARNSSMGYIDNKSVDILICTDIDEVLIDDFWDDCRKLVFTHPNFDRILYRYAWNHDESGNPDRIFWYDKTHQPNMYHWEYPVHETLIKNVGATCEGVYRLDENKIYLHHYPDLSKSRGSYLSLLELRAQEYPLDLYGLYYLGREYGYHNQFNKSIVTMTDLYHKLLQPSINDDMYMRPCVCNTLGEAYRKCGLNILAESWFKQGINDDHELRDNYIRLAQLYAWSNKAADARKLLEIVEEKTVYREDWRILPFMWRKWKKEQILADFCMWEGDYAQAAVHIKNALSDIKTAMDRSYAQEECLYGDIKFLKDHGGDIIE